MTNVPAVQSFVPAGAAPHQLEFGEMLRRAQILAKTELVPAALQNNPEAIVVIGVWGAEHGVPLMTAIQEVHVIEKRPSPSAQLRLALIRRAGHEVRFVESDSTRAVLRARRREYRHDPDAWVTVTYTIGDARRAELLDHWVERWLKPPGAKYDKKFTWKIGDDTGPADVSGAPAWVAEEIGAGRVHSKDNWRKYPADMLRARAASVLARMEFSDVMAALGVDQYTPEELGLDVGQDLDEPVEVPAEPQLEDGDAEEVIDDAVVVEDPGGEPEAAESTRPTTGQPPTPAAEPSPTTAPPQAPAGGHPVPRPGAGERQDQADLRYRLWALVPAGDKDDVRAWLVKCGVDPDSSDLSSARVAAIDAELDRRGYPRVRPAGDTAG